MSTLLNKSYLVKVSTKGGQKYPKFCLRGLYTAPNFKTTNFASNTIHSPFFKEKTSKNQFDHYIYLHEIPLLNI